MYHSQNSNPDAETNSLVKPGRQVFDYQLPPELPGTLWRIGASLAKGSFAAVYKGEWSCPGKETKTVAIKCVKRGNIGDDQFKTRTKRETVIWTTAGAHPNILPFIGYQMVDNAPMLVSPWCENGDLSDYIHKNPNITRSGKIKLLSDAARGLLHLHNLNPQIVHGDIKPENVIVQDDLVAALCDFGISKLHVEEHTGLTTSGATWVSGYQAKETLNEDPATPATDVYAFGGLILAAMSGKQPFWNKKPGATIIAVFNDMTPKPKDHPVLPAADPLWELLFACWSGQPYNRPPMSTVLETLQAERGIDEPAPEMEPPPSPGVPTNEEESVVRPGYLVFNRELPKPISGTLEKTGEIAMRGGFGDVYRGFWIRPNAEPVSVVIKCVRPPDDDQDETFKVRFKRETLIWSMVKHRNVLPFIGYQIVDEVPMLVSPWCKNGNLDIYTKAHPELTRSDKLELLCGAARGLLHLHSLEPPIFHGDLKPQNIIVQDNLEAALCDFGISRVILNEEEHSGWTNEATGGGTKGFQSPEILDKGPPTTAADVYAFAGVILATMSGQPPFWREKSAKAVALAIAMGKTPDSEDHSNLPETDNLWLLMRECWTSKPDSRPGTSDLLNRLVSTSQEESLVQPGNFVFTHQLEAEDASEIVRVADTQPNSRRQRQDLSEELTAIAHAPVPATQELIDLFQALGKAAPKAVRNKHKIYSILRVSRDICNHIMETGDPRDHQIDSDIEAILTRTEDYFALLDALEESSLQLAAILPSDITAFGADLYSSWSHSRSNLAEILRNLCRPPFSTISSHVHEILEDLFLDDCSWLSRLLYTGIYPEISTQYPDVPKSHPVFVVMKGLNDLEAQVKCGIPDEPTRELIIDIATFLAQTLASTSPDDGDKSLRESDSLPTEADRDWLVHALAETFSPLDLDPILQPSTAKELATKWADIKFGFNSRSPNGPGN